MADIRPNKNRLTPEKGELSSMLSGRDITRGYLQGLLTPQDSILTSQLGGDYAQYAEIARDDQVKALFQQRRLAVVSKEWDVLPGAEDPASEEAAAWMKDQLEALNWDDVTEKMLWGIMYGYSVSELIWGRDGAKVTIQDVKVRKQRRFRFGWNPDLYFGGLYLLTSAQPQGVLMPERKFWVFSTGADNSDEPYGLGLAHFLYWPVYFKRSGIKSWLIFLDRFAQPTPKAEVPEGKMDDDQYMDRVREILEAIQEDSHVIVPEGMVVELIEAARTGTASYEGMEEKMNRSIAKVIVSQLLTSEAAGGQYKAEVQDDIRLEVVKSDADMLCESWNRGPGRWLTEWNFPGATPPRVWRNVDPGEDLNNRAERDTKIYSLGFKPTPEYITEVYGEGWEPREMGLSPLPGLPGGEAPDAFAELDPITAARTAHRADQSAIVAAAAELSNRYRDVLGERVDELISMAEETGDLMTFRRQLNQLLEKGPKDQTVEHLERTGIFARLLGNLRGQEKAG